jgi:hypothetical protein
MVFENYNLKSYIAMNGYHVCDKSHILEKQVTLCGINNNQLIQYRLSSIHSSKNYMKKLYIWETT